MSKKLIVVVGTGPGIGYHVAKKFGDNHFRVVLISRSQAALIQYVEELKSQDIEAYAVVADVTSSKSVEAAFKKIKEEYGPVDVLVYNAALIEGGNPTSLLPETLLEHYEVDVVGALRCALQVIPDQEERKSGTILFTGGGLALHPSASHAALSIGKAGLRSLALTFAEELKPKGIFVGTVTVAGAVRPDTHFAPDLIAEKYWELYLKREEQEIVYR